MFPAFAFAIALNVLQPVDTPLTRPAPPPVSETTPVAVPPATPTALGYYTSGNRLWVLDQVLPIALLAAILFSGMSAKLRTWAERIGRNWFFTIVVYFALFTIATFIIALPLTYYEEFVRQHDYGLSNQTLQKWWTDSLTTLAVTCVAGGLFLWVKLPSGDSREFAQVALRHGVLILPGPTMSAAGQHAPFIRVPFLAEPKSLRAGVRRLSAAWREYQSGERRERPTLTMV